MCQAASKQRQLALRGALCSACCARAPAGLELCLLWLLLVLLLALPAALAGWWAPRPAALLLPPLFIVVSDALIDQAREIGVAVSKWAAHCGCTAERQPCRLPNTWPACCVCVQCAALGDPRTHHTHAHGTGAARAARVPQQAPPHRGLSVCHEHQVGFRGGQGVWARAPARVGAWARPRGRAL